MQEQQPRTQAHRLTTSTVYCVGLVVYNQEWQENSNFTKKKDDNPSPE